MTRIIITPFSREKKKWRQKRLEAKNFIVDLDHLKLKLTKIH